LISKMVLFTINIKIEVLYKKATNRRERFIMILSIKYSQDYTTPYQKEI